MRLLVTLQASGGNTIGMGCKYSSSLCLITSFFQTAGSLCIIEGCNLRLAIIVRCKEKTVFSFPLRSLRDWFFSLAEALVRTELTEEKSWFALCSLRGWFFLFGGSIDRRAANRAKALICLVHFQLVFGCEQVLSFSACSVFSGRLIFYSLFPLSSLSPKKVPAIEIAGLCLPLKPQKENVYADDSTK